MPAAVNTERFLRSLPGRIRVEVCGLLRNPPMADKLSDALGPMRGMLKIDPCCVTGRLLVVFDEKRTSTETVLQLIAAVERQFGAAAPETSDPPASDGGTDTPSEPACREAAAANESADASGVLFGDDPREPASSLEGTEAVKLMPAANRQRASPGLPSVPLPLALAMGGLVAIGAKQLLFGKSALARSPLPFYLSGVISVVTGYPFLKRGVSKFGADKKINTDLILGTGALALALIRENLVVLAGLSILQYVNWKRSRQALDQDEPVELPPEIQKYSNRAGRIGAAAAAATWALTRDPLRGIAVLLAANPRPAVIPAENAWKQAELEMQQHGLSAPGQLPLSRLARTRTLLLEDTSLVLQRNVCETECVSHEDEPDNLICTAASLLEKTDHSWKEDIWRKAKKTCRTIRTAFHVAAEEDGAAGTVRNTVYSVGTLAYCQRHNLSCENYYLEAKRLQKRGFDVLFVCKQTNKGVICHGLLYREPDIAADSQKPLSHWRQQGFQIVPLRDGVMAGRERLAELDFETGWLSLTEGDILERIASLHQEGSDVLLAAAEQPNETSRYLQEAGVPVVTLDRLDSVLAVFDGARKMDTAVNQHLEFTKKWNIAGSALAIVGLLSAPLVNLASDALSLIFLSRSRKTAVSAFARSSTSSGEVAAAAEALQWHAAPWERVADNFGVDERAGLSAEQVKAAKLRFGVNRLEQKKPVPWLASYLGQFKEFTMLVLIGTSLLAFFTGGMFDGLAMGAVLLANAAISTSQERKAEQVLQGLNPFLPSECTVHRDGGPERISAADLVPGDVISLEAGDRVPADLRIIRSWNLEVNESALTGESVPCVKTETIVGEERPLSERSNMLYMGTDVCRGKTLAVVVQTGMATEIGRLMSLLKKDDKEVTPLQSRVTSISKTFIKWAFLAGMIVFATGLLRGIPLGQMVSTSVTLAASAIPEGLPVTITIALSAGIFRMAKKKVFVRKLSALETLGRTTIICSDKTGTITQNEMTVKQIVAVGHKWTVSGNGYDVAGSIRADGALETADREPDHQPELHRIMQIAVLCNNSRIRVQENGLGSVEGDPTEGALLFMAAKTGAEPHNMTDWHRCEEIPFDSNSGLMSVVCKHAESERECYVLSKGAVESILLRCGKYQSDGNVFPLSDDIRRHILKQNEELAADALRVLGFAYRPIDPDDHSVQTGAATGVTPSEFLGDEDQMIYVGMAGMMDPPKAGVAESIREAQAMGVKPVMITGDHPITAIAVARQIGICDKNSKVLSGHELERMSDEDLAAVVEDISIYARVTPEQKLRIVKAYQHRGHIVAMTGDGVNDSPAIRQANVGIAMGKTGTEVTKETADIVLQEDHFGSIVEGVKEGRTIIGNIRKALGCLLTGNLAEIIVTSAAVIVGLPIPLVPIQILLMNLLTDALPAMVLAVSPGRNNSRTRHMDIVDKPLYQKVVTRGVLLGLSSLSLFALALASGAPIGVAQSVAFATLVAGQLIQTMSWRREGAGEPGSESGKDRYMIAALTVSWLALFAALYVPPVARFFHTAPLTFTHWTLILPVAASISLLAKPVLAALSRRTAGTAALRPVPSYAAA